MLPAFDDDGFLPPGVHRCTVEELCERFGSGSSVREFLAESLRHYLLLAMLHGSRRIVITGSYVTGKLNPGDVDVVILPGVGYDLDSGILESNEDRWPGLHVIVALDDVDFEAWIFEFFSTKRDRSLRGNAEVVP